MSEAFCEMIELTRRLGVVNIKNLPGCWEHQVDAQWHIAVNGQPQTVKASNGAEVPPYTMYVTYNGWPAGLISPNSGWIAAGAGANEDTFIAALKACHPGAHVVTE
jgi:hypothetical protein